eukprot:scaffold27203_cov54-Phaeocystis_antarctica.AAC.2
MNVLSDASTAAFQLRLEQLAALLEERLLEQRLGLGLGLGLEEQLEDQRAAAAAAAAAAKLAVGGDSQRVDCAAVASPSPQGGGAAADLANFDSQAALARLSGHVASALKYVRERELSTGSSSTAVDDSPESLAESHRRHTCAPPAPS